MQVAAAINAPAANASQSGGVTTVRLVAGETASLPPGKLLPATVIQVAQGQAVIVVNGQSLTVQPAGDLQPGTVFLVRASSSDTTTSVELLTNAADGSETLSLARVDVLAVLPDGRYRVQVNGEETLASSNDQLAVGGRYVMQVEETPTGLALTSAAEQPALPAALSAAILRGSLPPELGTLLKPLLAELATVAQTERNAPASLQQSAENIDDVLHSFLPDQGQAMNAAQLQRLVEDGGLHFEAKLARLAAEGDPDTGSDTGAQSQAAPRISDLKEGLLRLFQAAQEIGNAWQFPAARATLDGIESQQAANVFAQTQNLPAILQIPFPEGDAWRTLHLAIEPDGHGKGSGAGNGFRMLMHVPFADLGETWIDAGLSNNNLRAVIYLSRPAAIEQTRSELPALRSELMAEGFREVLLDVRPAADLPERQRQQATAMRLGRPAQGSVLDVKA